MKKIFSLFTAVLFAGSMLADVVTFTKDDFAGQGTANSGSLVSATKGGVTFEYSKGYCADESLRCYAHGAMSITASANIAKINFTTTGGKDGGLQAEVEVNATSYYIADLASQARLTEIKVTLGEGGGSEGGDQPGEGGDDPLPEDAISLDVVYASAGIFEDEDGAYWVLDLYKDYDDETEEVTYPEVVAIFAAKSKTALAGTYASTDIFDIYYVVAEGDTIWGEEFADIKIEYSEGVYSISLAFVDEDEKTYAVDIDIDDLYAYTYNEATEKYEDVELDEDGGQGGQGGDATDPTNCAEAREAALSVSGNNVEYNGGKVYTIEGYVTEIAFAWKDGSMSFWMADTKDGGKVLEAYKCAIEKEADAVKVGDKVRVTGKLTKYNTTPEFAAGCTVEIVEKGEGGGGDQPSTKVETITVARALEIGGALEARKSTTETYRIVGYVTVITDDSFDTDFNNMTFWMADTKGSADSNDEGAFYAFRVKPDVKLAVGDKVSVETVIKKYENNDKSILIESGTSGAKATKLSDTAVENSSVAVKSVKRIENAMLIIERNGVRYNVMGQIVR